MMRFSYAFAVLIATAIPAIAAAQSMPPPPALRASVTVTSDVVRIGDLVENAGAVADVPIFRSPDLGTRGVVSTDSVVEAIRPHQLIGIDTRGLSEVVVTRASRAISVPDITTSVAQALAARYGLGNASDLAITFDRAMRPLQVEPNAAGDLRVLALDYDRRSGRFDATLDLPASAVLRRQPAHYSGIAVETIPVVAVEHPMERGEVLQASDLTILRRPKAEFGAIGDIAQAAGLAARHQLRPGQPLHAADLMKPEIVQRNDTVTIVYEAPGLMLTLRGQAQDSGALGDTINVLNKDTKRVIQGVVTGPGRVNVGGTTRLVNNVSSMVVSPTPSQQSE